jgi:hypothetical protein
MNNLRILAALIAVAGLMVVIYSLLSYQSSVSGYGGHDGMVGAGSSVSTQYYTATNMFLAILGALLLASGIIYAIPRRLTEAWAYPTVAFAPATQAAGVHEPAGVRQQPSKGSSEAAIMDNPALGPSLHGSEGGSEIPQGTPICSTSDPYDELVLRLLSGDERTMFRTIKDAGGEALQRDLVTTTKMSEAKVSRVIDRLVEKGLVVKERNGMGNKIWIQVET